MDFDSLVPAEEPVKFRGKQYVLREADADAVRRYRNAIFKCTRTGDNGRISAGEGLADTEPLLVSLCLFEVTDKGEKPVSLPTVLSWPGHVVKAIFEKAKEISRLNELPDKEQEKNVSSGSPNSSTAG